MSIISHTDNNATLKPARQSPIEAGTCLSIWRGAPRCRFLPLDRPRPGGVGARSGKSLAPDRGRGQAGGLAAEDAAAGRGRAGLSSPPGCRGLSGTESGLRWSSCSCRLGARAVDPWNMPGARGFWRLLPWPPAAISACYDGFGRRLCALAGRFRTASRKSRSHNLAGFPPRCLILRHSGVIFIVLIDQSARLRLRNREKANHEHGNNQRILILGKGWLEEEANFLAPASVGLCIVLLLHGFCTREQ